MGMIGHSSVVVTASGRGASSWTSPGGAEESGCTDDRCDPFNVRRSGEASGAVRRGIPASVELGTALSAGWASGISMYGVGALLGIAGRLGWTDSPSWLEHPVVIGLALALAALEFVVDKI